METKLKATFVQSLRHRRRLSRSVGFVFVGFGSVMQGTVRQGGNR